MYKQIVILVFLYSPFSNIGGVFRYVRQGGGQVRKIAISLQWTSSYTFGISTLSNNLSNFWVHLALDKIVYCENITTYIKSHLNRKYAMDFFLNLYKKWNRNYTKRIG